MTREELIEICNLAIARKNEQKLNQYNEVFTDAEQVQAFSYKKMILEKLETAAKNGKLGISLSADVLSRGHIKAYQELIKEGFKINMQVRIFTPSKDEYAYLHNDNFFANAFDHINRLFSAKINL